MIYLLENVRFERDWRERRARRYLALQRHANPNRYAANSECSYPYAERSQKADVTAYYPEFAAGMPSTHRKQATERCSVMRAEPADHPKKKIEMNAPAKNVLDLKSK